MAIRFIEGFETERTSTHAARRYETVTGTYGSSENGRKNSNGFALSGTAFNMVTPALVTSLGNTWTVGFGVYFESGDFASLSTFPGVYFLDGGDAGTDEQLGLRFNGQALVGLETCKIAIEVVRGATVLGTSDIRLDLARWYYIEFQVTIHPSTGSYEVRINESVDAGASDTAGTANTANQGTAGADRVNLSWQSSPSADVLWYDDIYIKDDGTYLNDFVVEGLASVAGDGDTAQWQLAGAAVDVGTAFLDSATANSLAETNDRIQTDTVGEISLANFEDLSFIQGGTIHCVQVAVLGRMETSGQRDVQPRFRHINGSPSEHNGTAVTYDNTMFQLGREVFETNPATASAWVVNDIDLGQWGVRLDA